MENTVSILKKYWGFESFRGKQLDIINAVLSQEDVLALLPTGGGKSICFQVPAMMMDGLCLVVSPLIALMEDQVTHLRAKNINAIAINSSMSKRQIDIALDNAIYGDTKFLYVSPERLNSNLFKVRFAKMKINLIAVDEAHCISQWGYDFRPSYLDISELKKIKPDTPFLALTATATKEVIIDIQEKLEFAKEKVILQSFERKNLTYNTEFTTNKLNKIVTFLKKNKGSGIIYCSTRRKVKDLFLILKEKGFSVDYYHAGLEFDERKKKQKDWTNNNTKIIISTNAFGMGIDKPDVRFVLHHDIPSSLEAYFQEAGRGGRDGNNAVASLFYEKADINQLRKWVELKYPPIDTIKRIYNALGNHFQLAIGAGKEEIFPIDLAFFSEKYNQPLILVYNALKFLELCGFIRLSENYKQPSQLRILGTNQDVYNQQIKDEDLNKILLFILRTEIGVFDNHVRINEYKIASKTGLSVKVVRKKLIQLGNLTVIDYIPRSNLPSVTYVTERLLDSNLSISPKFYLNRKNIAFEKLEQVIDFVTSESCKSEFLLNYFGEKNTSPCGNCINCLIYEPKDSFSLEELVLEKSHEILRNNEKVDISDLFVCLKNYPESEILTCLRDLMEQEVISMDSFGKEYWIDS